MDDSSVNPNPSTVAMEIASDAGPPMDRTQSTTVMKGADGEDILMPDVEAMKQAKEMRELAPESVVVQLGIAAAELLVDFFKMVIASLLSVFTPQLCPLLDPASADPVCLSAVGFVNNEAEREMLIGQFNNTGHVCSIQENFTDLTPFNQGVLGFNFITLAIVLIHYWLAWRRERFMIEKLELSNLDTRIHLREIIHQYPHIEDRLQWYNRRVFELSVFGIVIQLINVLMSAVLVFQDYYEGFSTVTSFFTSVLITATVLKNAAANTWVGMQHRLAYSCVTYDPVSYNNVNPKYRLQGK